MNSMTTCIAVIAAGCALSLGGCDTRTENPETPSSHTPPDRNTPTRSADNTGNNRDDIGRDDARTPMDQSESSEHIQRTADIRRAIVADDTLSMGAKNCKIITDESGAVWLRGVVDSQAEKDLIERLARQAAGPHSVTNELEIDTD